MGTAETNRSSKTQHNDFVSSRDHSDMDSHSHDRDTSRICRACGQVFQCGEDRVNQPVQCPSCHAVQSASSEEAHAGGIPPVVEATASPNMPADHSAGSDLLFLGDDESTSDSVARHGVIEPRRETVDRMSVERSLGASSIDTPARNLFNRMIGEIGKIFVGQDELVLGSLVALFSSGHVLVESVPGLGKTLFVRTLGRVLGCQFSRIQFTADLMPSDITGAPIFDMKTQEFRFRPGPVFTQISAGRRDQSFAGQDPRRAAGDHAGVPCDGRRQEPHARPPLPGHGDAESD